MKKSPYLILAFTGGSILTSGANLVLLANEPYGIVLVLEGLIMLLCSYKMMKPLP